MIPKIIHYCWFGKNPKPKDVLKCIESWKKYLPDYEIKEWNESNYDVCKCQYMADAYKEKKWAFVSDYCRIDVVNRYGGIYLDTDVEVIKSFDPLLDYKFFCGYEKNENAFASGGGGKLFVNFGLGFGAEKSCAVLQDILNIYHDFVFYKEDGRLNLINCPIVQTDALKKYGVTCDGNNVVVGDYAVFSPEYFCPQSFYTGKTKVTRNTYSIHHYSCSWKSGKERMLIKFLGLRFANIVIKFKAKLSNAVK